ncbi:pilus assembly protein [Xanthomonas graminis]|uniref:pilus assembly protein n=1 Tax=Xanthomonas graminis TaxID=3390026 RepID=UPI001F1C31C4|nr:pilus assembly protein [Xanthomonas translucens]UKE75001.1 pilus assembly protein [Xanthomonas translucens pv. phleipratensis]
MTSRAKNATRRDSFLAVAAGLLIGTIGGAGAEVDVSQSPLYVGSSVPGNLAIVPSVEYPTVISKANLSDTYSATAKFVGYFDSKKCYKYHYSTTETDRYFYPVSSLGDKAANFSCAGVAGSWSGNFLNWAATQTIDPFRSALTGGYRVVDTETTTILEKAVADRPSEQNFPRRVINNNAALITGGTSATWKNLNIRIDGLFNKMRFGYGATTDTVVAYDPTVHALNGSYLKPDGTACTAKDNKGCVLDTTLTFEVSVRVKVCDKDFLEDNCVAYPSGGYKPEGLIQEYSTRIRYSIFGYKNVDIQQGAGADTGILRAKQKFVGPYSYNPDEGKLANTVREWDPRTGVIYKNPDSTDAANTTAVIGGAYSIDNSGVINYLNKFGQLNTGKNVKSFDDVSELYYAAIRYFKHQGNIASYSALSGDSKTKYQQADGFPVITSWNDPISYRCQVNVILGIGDTNTHYDKNLPGNTGNLNGEPTQPAEVTRDKSVNVITRMTQIWRKEGQTPANAATKASASSFNGNGNSAYIAALAYDAHTKDMRPDTAADGLPGKQTLSTHWVDVVEYGNYKSPGTNQYWLTAKYGGFQVPGGYDPDTNFDALSDPVWWDGISYVNNDKNYKQPDNYYIAADAGKMIVSLRKAFERILDEMKGSAASLASNTSKLELGARTYQSAFYSGTWRGDLVAYNVEQATGSLAEAWSANDHFPAWNTRVIKFASGATTLANFAYGNLTGTPLSSANQQQIDYLRGDRSNEKANGGKLRTRTGLMGDIVNSQPVYVGSPNARLYTTASFTGASAYASFASAKAARSAMLYVGANDGMLHGFDAGSGAEKFAFVPKAAMTGLLNYTDPDYEHRYYVDGELTVSDIYDTASASWRSILVGTMGRGGKGMFALDVTDPDNISLLWDKTSTDLAALGNNLGKPIIGQLGNGQWYAMVGNGPNNSGDSADLVMVNILSGDSSSIATGAAGDNGLSSVLAWSSNNDYIVDRIYAGDLKGNLWRFDMTGASGKATRLFTAQYGAKTQPITAAPTAAKDPSTGLTWVFFGTGKYLSDGDISNKDVQTWYGLIDRGSAIASDRSTLNKVDIEQQGVVNGYAVRVIEDQPSPGVNGWYMDLIPPSGTAEGERMVVSNFFQGTALIGTTRIPESGDVCKPSGKGFVMAINPFTGGRMPQSFFDLDRSGGSSTGDTLNGKPVSGIGLDSSPNSPIFIGNQMQIGLDDASTVGLGTNSSALSMKRVSWRELLRND